MGLETGLRRLGRGRDWFLRLPPKGRLAVAAAGVVVVGILIATDFWPLLVLGGFLLFGQFGKEAEKTASGAFVEDDGRQRLQAKIAARKQALLQARAQPATQAEAASDPLEAEDDAEEAVTPTPAAGFSVRPIVEHGDAFWRRKGSPRGVIVE
jgi:hypothetical protein